MRRSRFVLCLILLLIPLVVGVLTLTLWHAWGQRQLNEALIEAVRAGNVRAVRVLLLVGADPYAGNQSHGRATWRVVDTPFRGQINSSPHGIDNRIALLLMEYAGKR